MYSDFQFDFSIFNDTVMPNKCAGKKSKYPRITPDYQSDNVPRLWFGKFRKTMQRVCKLRLIFSIFCFHHWQMKNDIPSQELVENPVHTALNLLARHEALDCMKSESFVSRKSRCMLSAFFSDKVRGFRLTHFSYACTRTWKSKCLYMISLKILSE